MATPLFTAQEAAATSTKAVTTTVAAEVTTASAAKMATVTNASATIKTTATAGGLWYGGGGNASTSSMKRGRRKMMKKKKKGVAKERRKSDKAGWKKPWNMPSLNLPLFCQPEKMPSTKLRLRATPLPPLELYLSPLPQPIPKCILHSTRGMPFVLLTACPQKGLFLPKEGPHKAFI